jgi:hypothetical protein
MAITPDTLSRLSLGNRDGIVASFTAIANNDDWTTGLSAIEHVSITGDNSGNETHGCTVSGGVVTFKASAQLDNVTVLVIGFK